MTGRQLVPTAAAGSSNARGRQLCRGQEVQVGEVFVGGFQLKTVLCLSKGGHDSVIRGYKTADSGKRVTDLLLRIPPCSSYSPFTAQ